MAFTIPGRSDIATQARRVLFGQAIPIPRSSEISIVASLTSLTRIADDLVYPISASSIMASGYHGFHGPPVDHNAKAYVSQDAPKRM